MHIRDLFESNVSIFHTPKDFGYRRDNPGRDECLRKRETVEKMSKEYGGPSSEGLAAKMLTGWPTANMGIFKPMFFPVRNLIHLDGANNEHFHRKPGEPKYDSLARSVTDAGWNDRHPVMVRVNHRGMAYIVEGNTRVRIANANNIKYISVQFEWMNGVEEDDGPWSPSRVAEIAVPSPLNEAVNDPWKFHGYEADDFKPRMMTEPRVLYRSVSLPELEDIFSIGKVMGGQNKFNDFETRRWVFFADEITEQLKAQGEEIERQAVHSLSGHEVHREFKRLTNDIEEQGMMILTRMQKLGVEYDEDYEDAFMRGEYADTMNHAIRQNRTLAAADRGWFREALNELFALHRKRYELQDQYQVALKARHTELRDRAKDLTATSAIIVTKPISGGLHYSKDWGKSGFQTSEFGFHPGQVTVEDIDKVLFFKEGQKVGTVVPSNVLNIVRKILGVR